WRADLLDWLASDFQENGHELRHTQRLIATSTAYRSRAEATGGEDEGAAYVYAGPRAKRLTAEQFNDLMWGLSSTAPPRFDAPVLRGISDPETGGRLVRSSTWIWGPSAASGTPSGGE